MDKQVTVSISLSKTFEVNMEEITLNDIRLEYFLPDDALRFLANPEMSKIVNLQKMQNDCKDWIVDDLVVCEG